MKKIVLIGLIVVLIAPQIVGEVRYITTAEFKSKIMNYEVQKEWNYIGKKPCVVYFYTTWAGPCKKMAPFIEELSNIYDKVDFYKADTEKERELAYVFQISSIPQTLYIPIEGEPILLKGIYPKDDIANVINKELMTDKYIAQIQQASQNNQPQESNISSTKNIAENTPPNKVKDEIDINIPSSHHVNDRTFAVVIGNENYEQVVAVPYAINDAKIFAQYCKKTLGLPEHNVRLYTNVTYGKMLSAIKDIKAIANAYNGDISVIFYYAGHGVPNESSKDAFLLPVDADGTETEVCMPLSRLYNDLSNLNAKNVVVLLDACFSGAQRGDGMLASARGVAIKSNPASPKGNMLVLSAASGDETAYPYNDKGHGLFTYFLLKKLQETNGNVSLLDLGEYITTNVRQQSIVINRKSQTPSVSASPEIGTTWYNWKLK